MWQTKESRKTTAKKEQIWKLWAEVPNWKLWDNNIEVAELFGSFQKGSNGILKPKNGPKAKFKIIECTDLKSFTTRTTLPFCQMDFIHCMNDTKDGLVITHRIEIKGLLSFLFSKIIGNTIKAGLPKTVEKMIELAEKK